MRAPAAAAALYCLAVAAPGLGQSGGYRAPGSFANRPTSQAQQLEGAMDSAPWSLGRFFVEPWIGLSNLSYADERSRAVDDPGVDDPGADLSGTFGAGLRVYRPVASELVFEAHFLPAYVWYRDQSDRRRTNGEYGMGLFGDLGRTNVEVSVSRRDENQFLSSQFQQRVNQRDETAIASLNVELVSGMAIFGDANRLRISSLEEGSFLFDNLSALDREEQVYRAGLRFRSRRGFELGLALEESEVIFDNDLFDRSNSGTSPVVELGLGGDRLWLNADIAFRSLEPLGASQFVPFDGVTGKAEVLWQLRPRLALRLLHQVDLVYSLDSTWAYYENVRSDLGLSINFSLRDSMTFFVEQGQDDYTALVAGLQPRIDDVDAYGAQFQIRLAQLTLGLRWDRTTYDSSLLGFSRTVDVVSTNLGLSFGLEVRP